MWVDREIKQRLDMYEAARLVSVECACAVILVSAAYALGFKCVSVECASGSQIGSSGHEPRKPHQCMKNGVGRTYSK